MEAQLLFIYQECSVLVERRAKRIVGSQATAQDICQQVFMRVLDDLRSGVEIRHPSAYCYRAATNLALNWLRDTRRRDELLEQQGTDLEPGFSAQDNLMVRELIARCSDVEDAAVASYHYIDGLDQTEIAALLGTSRRSVNRRLERFNEYARRALSHGPAGHVGHLHA